ncbi:peptidase domain-containing ABC transporter [Thiorhodovibrio frisius]|uniref:ABC-type bacteriocin/lantibiotic exporter with N-terminal double-glycine peptidase domain n=1 Tax=Thiorhodovibrio frisius TaxID=631362 RepID=H8YYA2_9GAMM|nr:ATP-binding cassette domain-containing protein [Thiorhodovibrio frisius]EIC23428.1 ABC-type bacteriocin/lantibiotic exporter with N-terminal double-glycine peptidase domain [Thiorhodovibrio frisius]WPL23490.1 Alpha-hemolysin translocation ATP-binding protein HlyB [Thiorhodovibrio frisius]
MNGTTSVAESLPPEPRQSKAGQGKASQGKANQPTPLKMVLQNPELRRVLPGLAVSSFLSNLLALALPLAILQILDRVIVNHAFSTLAFLTIGLIAAIVLEQTLRLANGVITGWLTARREHQLTMSLADHLCRVPLRVYQREEPSAYAEKLRNANRVARFYSGEAVLGLLDLPFVAIFLLLIGFIGGPVVGVPLAIIVVFLIVMARYGHDGSRLSEGRDGQEERRSGFLFEVFTGIHSVKAMMMEDLMLRRYERLQRSSSEAGEKSAELSNRLDRVGHYLSQLMVVGVIFVGSLFVIRGQMTPGGLAACLILSVRLMRPLRRSLNVRNQIDDFERANARLQSLFDLPATEERGKPSLPPISQGIELRDVQVLFRETRLFEGVNLSLPKGAFIAIQSDSGSGKSTLLNLMSGAEQPDGGDVLVDGRPLSDYAASSVPEHIALLPQAGAVVAGTILENLTMFDDQLNERALAIAHELGLEHFVASMKFGYETRLGETANEMLSGGTLQLISIVRALVREPEVILFDEANGFLDMETDQTVRRYLEKCRRQRTVVMVTQRPSYLALADKIYHFENGALVEGALQQALAPETIAPALQRPESVSDSAVIVADRFSEPNDLSRCLLPLLGALGWHGRQRELSEALPHFDQRLDLSGFFAVLVELGYWPAAIGKLRQVPDDRLLPCLLLPEKSAGCVILGREPDGRLRLLNGDTGTETLVDEIRQPAEYYSFAAEQEKAAEQPGDKQWVAQITKRFRHHRRIILFATIVATVLSLSPPLFVRATWDFVIPARDFSVAVNLVVGVLIAILLGWIVSLTRGRLLAYIGGRADYILGVNLTKRLLCLPSAALDKIPVARQVRRVRGLGRLRQYFVGPMARLVFDLPATLIIVLALVVINPWMSIVLLVSVIAFALAGWLSVSKSRDLLTRTSRQTGMRAEFLDEVLGSMRVIRRAGAQNLWLQRLRETSGSGAFSGAQENRFNHYIRTLGQIIASLTGLSALVASAVLAVRGDITNGTLIATQILIWRTTGPLQNVFVSATASVRVKENVRQLENLMRLPTEDERGVRQTLRPESPGGLTVSRVSFRYSNDADPSLLGVDFQIKPHQFVALSGASGSGKSTILKMFLGMYTPQAGSILIDDIDIRQLTVADLRGRISYMPQNCDIFYGSIFQNLMLVHPGATRAEVYWAAEMAGLMSDADGFPEGLQTRISGTQISQISGGFRQRLSLARAMLKPASIVLMDEPGNGMDQNGEAALLRCLQWLRGRSTLVVATMRPSHLKLADVVVTMRTGRVESIGSYKTQVAGSKAGKG